MDFSINPYLLKGKTLFRFALIHISLFHINAPLLSQSFIGKCKNVWIMTKAVVYNSNVYQTRVPFQVKKIARLNGEAVSDSITYTISVERQYIQKEQQNPISSSQSINYSIVSEDDNGYVIIKILPCVKLVADTNIVYDPECTSGEKPDDFLYMIVKDSFKPLAKIPKSTKIVGTPLVFPVKLRPKRSGQELTMTGEFTAGYSFGLRIKLSRKPYKQSYLNIICPTLGVTGAKHFKKNNDGSFSEKVDAWAVTGSYGFLFTVKKVNFGLFRGHDFMVGGQNDWFYQGKGWWSLGLGYNFK